MLYKLLTCFQPTYKQNCVKAAGGVCSGRKQYLGEQVWSEAGQQAVGVLRRCVAQAVQAQQRRQQARTQRRVEGLRVAPAAYKGAAAGRQRPVGGGRKHIITTYI